MATGSHNASLSRGRDSGPRGLGEWLAAAAQRRAGGISVAGVDAGLIAGRSLWWPSDAVHDGSRADRDVSAREVVMIVARGVPRAGGDAVSSRCGAGYHGSGEKARKATLVRTSAIGRAAAGRQMAVVGDSDGTASRQGVTSRRIAARRRFLVEADRRSLRRRRLWPAVGDRHGDVKAIQSLGMGFAMGQTVPRGCHDGPSRDSCSTDGFGWRGGRRTDGGAGAALGGARTARRVVWANGRAMQPRHRGGGGP